MSKKNWVIARVAPASSLRFRLSRSPSELGACGWVSGIGGDRDFEIGDPPQAGHQIGRVVIAVRVRLIGRRRAAGRRAGRRCGARRPPSIDARHLVHLPAAGADAGQMRRRHQGGLPHDAGHSRVGARARAAAGAIGDRHEARAQRLKPADAAPELCLQCLGLRRKELERQQRRLRPG